MTTDDDAECGLRGSGTDVVSGCRLAMVTVTQRVADLRDRFTGDFGTKASVGAT